MIDPKTLTQRRALEAYRLGYRVISDGRLLNPEGKELVVRLYGKQRYAVFTVHGKSIPVHQFAALCFFGSKAWQAECVRHVDNNPLNNSRGNIRIGSFSENERDKVVSSRRRLSREQILRMRRLYKEGTSISLLARSVGVSWWTASYAVKGQRGYAKIRHEAPGRERRA